jgi:hypothetical protein
MGEDILTEEELKRAVQKIFRLSQTDPEFRTLCLSDPNEAIRRITGKAVAPGVEIQFLDSAADKTKDPGGAAK